MTPESLTSRLHDIHDLDPVGIWPLAAGWWLVIVLGGCLVLLAVAIRRWRPDWQRYLPRYGWTHDAERELALLRERIGGDDVKMLASELSELLRRIAIARCGRDRCAGLHGDAWLDWLTDHDPAGFDWRSRGRMLLNLPYAPPGEPEQQPELHHLIDAVQVWTAQPWACTAGSGRRDGV